MRQHRIVIVHTHEVIGAAEDVLTGLASLLTRFAVEFHLTWRQAQSLAGQGT